MKNALRISSIFLSAILAFSPLYPKESISDVSQLAVGYVEKIYAPKSFTELQKIVKAAKKPIAIAGGRYSQGGHIWIDDGIVIDMKNLNTIKVDVKNKTLTAQAGATWDQIQQRIDPDNLSVKVMQSYHDFTVGGSLSVNVHGRTIPDGSLIETVKSIKVMLADGTIVTATRDDNSDIFKGAIGGYGAIGIILEATFDLTDNEIIERHEVIMTLAHYPEFFKNMVRDNPSVVFHNADLSVTNYDKVSSITWYKSNQTLTDPERFQANGTLLSPSYYKLQAARYFRDLQKLRFPLQAAKLSQAVTWRNNEMSTSVVTAEPLTRLFTTTVLQEYFVPCARLAEFVDKFEDIVKQHNVNVMNISIRYVHKDKDSIMAYAQPEESFSLVCYINMRNSKGGMKKAQEWTRKAIDAVLACGGTYYLPYQLHATKEQFFKAYPRAQELIELKKRLDPTNKFMNSFIKKYLV